MSELASIADRVEVTALAMGHRVSRIYDALHLLREATLLQLQATLPADAAIEPWFTDQGFGIDEHGYFERLPVLERARAGESDPLTQTYYANEEISKNPEARRRMFAMRDLPRVVRAVKERLEGLAWIYYQDATGFAMTYPMHDPCTVVPADFNWHEYYTYVSVSPEANPEREIRWTPPNVDYGGKGLMVSVSIPLYDVDELIGVWSFDVPVRSLVADSVVDSVVGGQTSFVVGHDGQLVAHDALEVVALTEGAAARVTLANLGEGFADLDLARLFEQGVGHERVLGSDGEMLYAVYRVVPSLRWLLMATFPARDVLAAISSAGSRRR